MPGFNGRGPLNEGPMTGWRRGRCTDHDARDYRPGSGAGFYGQGYSHRTWGAHRNWNGGGRGFGHGYGFHWRNPLYSIPEDGLSETAGQSSGSRQSELNLQLTRVLDQLSELLRHIPGPPETDNETK